MFIPQEIIRKKRDNIKLSKNEINEFIKGITNGYVTDAQISAFTMAIFFRGLSKDELVNFTLSMRDSGDVLKWNGLNGPVVDKHSTGGVGDLISLILAPVVAACGLYVPMIVGRGLGHTGGTSDKLDSIEGYNTQPEKDIFYKTVKNIGCAIIGQSKNLAPADKKIYAIRDITATTDSLALITSSILSKKLASGLEFLVMDIKTGNGAFLTEIDQSRELAKGIVDIGNQAGCKTSAIISDMNQPLSKSIGNALEIKNVIEYLKNESKNSRLHELNLALGVEMLVKSGLYKNKLDASNKFNEVLENGKAAEIFSKMISSLGGPLNFLEKYNQYLPTAKYIKPVYSNKEGKVVKIDTKEIGMILVGLGGGRINPNDEIDHSVGFTEMVSLNQDIKKDKPIAFIHAKNEEDFLIAEQKLLESIEISDDKAKYNYKEKIIYQYIS